MKKQYKKQVKPTSYRVSKSMYYNCFALVVNGREVAWGDKRSMEIKREEKIKTDNKRSMNHV